MAKNDAYEARVQVLTAEVRTLVVGSRQITMSVYNQLDMVAPDEIEPFGRVNARDVSGRWVDVIGRHAKTGVLTSSLIPVRADALDDSGRFPTGPGQWTRYLFWRADVDARQQREQFTKVATEWAALDLIVLAGLR